ncbi:MAG: BrnT family toxin [Pyrinomonadaceae bacterium]
MSVGFEWDARKATLNLGKHRVSFDEATTVFDDPLAVIFDDLNHSTKERREIIVGHSIADRLLLVCFSERTEMIRILSARQLTRRERRDYEEGTHNK